MIDDVQSTKLPHGIAVLSEHMPGLRSVTVARIVELRYFTGFTIEETAEALGISPATVKRDWTWARAWLYQRLSLT